MNRAEAAVYIFIGLVALFVWLKLRRLDPPEYRTFQRPTKLTPPRNPSRAKKGL